MAGCRIQVLGCGDAFGSGGRNNACFWVHSGTDRFMLDFGASSLIAMRARGVDPNNIDFILLSHLHGDHFGGLPFLLLDAQLVSRRERPLLIAGPPGVERRTFELMEAMFPGSPGAKPRYGLTFVELHAGETTPIAGVSVTPFEVRHPSGASSYALRIECGGRVLAYSGDTEWVENLVPAAREADLFICECYVYDKKVPFHLSYTGLMEHLAEIAPKRLLLTHMSRPMLARAESLDHECAEDGKIIEVE